MSNAASSEDFGVRKTSLYTNTVESPMLQSFPNSQATVMSVGDGLIQPHESRAQPSNKVSITPLMLGDFFRKLPHPLETLMKDFRRFRCDLLYTFRCAALNTRRLGHVFVLKLLEGLQPHCLWGDGF